MLTVISSIKAGNAENIKEGEQFLQALYASITHIKQRERAQHENSTAPIK